MTKRARLDIKDKADFCFPFLDVWPSLLLSCEGVFMCSRVLSICFVCLSVCLLVSLRSRRQCIQSVRQDHRHRGMPRTEAQRTGEQIKTAKKRATNSTKQRVRVGIHLDGNLSLPSPPPTPSSLNRIRVMS